MTNLKTHKTRKNGSITKDTELVYSASAFSFFIIFQYADIKDLVLMSLGFIGSVGDGIAVPTMMLIMTGVFDAFGHASTHSSTSHTMLMNQINKYVIYFIYAGFAAGISCFLEAASWIKTAERQASRLRCLYLKAILRQDLSFFDMQSNTAEIIDSIGTDSQMIQEVIAEKVPHFIVNLSNFIASYTVGIYMAWQLSITALAFLPLLVLPGILYGRILAEAVKKMREEYMKAGVVAEMAISSIRTIYSFVGEERTLELFSKALETTVKLGLKQGLAKGLTVGSNGVVFAIWGFMAWYGNKLILNHGLNGGNVIATGLASITGGLSLGNCLPNLKYFLEASLAGARIVEMINREPAIDQEPCIKKKRGKILDTVVGNLELKNVRFTYPARPDTMIFNGFSLSIEAGKTTALVGGSGCGKSTIIALLERFYDPLDGEILFDGTNVKHLHLPWLRAQIGLVSQEPALFATTIKHNILLGKQGANMEEIIEAAKKSNAHSFISQLPEAYETQVGEHGVQLSGGQKQRIAIARALLIDPPILLLDEATSALDAESENVVQDALNQAALGRTTLVISHRLSTIQNADLIAVMQKGQVIETGQHEDLLQRDGSAYAELIHASSTEGIISRGQKEENGSHLQESQQFMSDAQVVNEFDPRPPKNIVMVRQTSNSSCISRSSSFNGCHPPELQLKEEMHNSSSPPSFRRLVLLNKPEWRQALIGTAGAACFGVIQPLYAFTIGGMIVAFYMTDHTERARYIRNYSLSFVALAVASFITNAIQHYNFAVVGEKLTKRVRERMLMNILQFEVAWFDAPENNSSAICTRLASAANSVKSLVGDRWSLIITTFVSIIAATSFGLAIAWRLALVIMACQPLVILCFYCRRVLIKTISKQALCMQQDSSKLAAEAVVHHRTIAAFCAQPTILKLYANLQQKSSQASTRQALIGGLGLGSAQLISFFSLALDYWYGAHLVSEGLISSGEMFKTFFILVSTGRVIAESGSMTSDIAKGAAAVGSVFEILDRISNIIPDNPEGEKPQHLNGDVELRHIDFAYPQRPKILVFQDFNLHIHAGQSMALVGQSGSGKSTVISLIERFYDPIRGKVKIDGKDIRQFHLRTLRKHIALVSQEPTLFEGSIRENILYNNGDASEEEIVKAAEAANAHNFISALQNGYETNVGERGLQLSGGQKQRIAIARAILKKPAILLLDEATSALDVKSEKVVQEALEQMMVGRTTVVVAHRLSTILNCHTIAVLQKGTIVESGTHAELISRGDVGAYFNLVKLQQHRSNVSSLSPDSLPSVVHVSSNL